MRKFLTAFLLVLMAFVVVACDNNDKPPVENHKPVLVGVDPVDIYVGDTFDNMAGVTATDELDGDLTDDIVVTGTVDTTKAGTYTLTYKVENSLKETASKDRVVTVLEKPGLGGLTGGDFPGTSLGDGWVAWYDSSTGYDVEYTVNNGQVEIDIKTAPSADSQWWAVQLQYNKLVLEAFESYTLKFEVKADEKRYMNHQIQGGGMTDKAYGEINIEEITTTWKTVEVDFYVKVDALNAQLQFSFGNFADVDPEFKAVETKVYLRNVEIVEGPELENQAPEINANNIVVRVGEETPLRQGITVFDDFSDLKPGDVKVVQVSPETPFDPADPKKGVYVFNLSVEDGEGLEAIATRTITVAEPWNRPIDMTVGEAADGWWAFNADETEFIKVTNEGEITKVEIKEIANDDWKAMLRVDNVQFFAGEYEITFKVKADAERDVRVALEHAGLAEAYLHFTAEEDWTEVTLNVEFDNDQFDKTFAFWFGSLTTGRPGVDEGTYVAADDVLTNVYFKDFAVAYEGQEVLRNTWNRPLNFKVTGIGSWELAGIQPGWYIREVDAAEGEHYLAYENQANGVTKIEILDIPADDWKSSFRMDQVNYYEGTYVITFEAKADVERHIRAAFDNSGLPGEDSFYDIKIEENWEEYTITLNFTQDELNKSFEFFLGTLTTGRPNHPDGENPFDAEDDILTTLYFRNLNVVYTPPTE